MDQENPLERMMSQQAKDNIKRLAEEDKKERRKIRGIALKGIFVGIVTLFLITYWFTWKATIIIILLGWSLNISHWYDRELSKYERKQNKNKK
jgi:hypothetical protein